MNKRQVLIFLIVGLCLSGLYPYGTSRAESKAGNSQETAADIPFNDPAHVFYFNYQSYLVKHGKDGTTSETWQVLPGPERAKKVAEGEAFLKKLHSELLAKDNLSSNEIELFQAVWGKSEAEGDTGRILHSAVAGEKSIPVQKVNAVSKNLEGFQKKENWNLLFDGYQYKSHEGGGLVISGVPVQHVAEHVESTLKREVVPTSVGVQTPVPEKEENNSKSGATPLVVYLSLLAAVTAFFSAKYARKRGVLGAGGVLPQNGQDIKQLPLWAQMRITHGYADAKEQAKYSEQPQSNPGNENLKIAGCLFTCLQSCQDDCKSGCQSSCQTSCQDSCERSCQDSCKSSCQSACKSGCHSSCERNCQYTCMNSCQDITR